MFLNSLEAMVMNLFQLGLYEIMPKLTPLSHCEMIAHVSGENNHALSLYYYKRLSLQLSDFGINTQ